MDDRTMKSIKVLGSNMAYVDMGQGPVVLFQHGNPTSSYLWRNVIPHVMPHARCIAPDLIGMGRSDKPDVAYRAEDHARYFQAFIKALDIKNVVLVLHDWGSAIGLDWARRHEAQVRGLALMEFITPIPTWLDMTQESFEWFKKFRDPVHGRETIIGQNAFIEQTLPGAIVRKLTDMEMDAYRRPFLDPADREPVYRFPNELPIAGEPADVYAMAMAYRAWLLETEISKLFFWADPGSLMPVHLAKWYQTQLKNTRSVALGSGMHYVQEDHPELIGREIAAWLLTLK
jgi:haloalkane dehalogenase